MVRTYGKHASQRRSSGNDDGVGSGAEGGMEGGIEGGSSAEPIVLYSRSPSASVAGDASGGTRGAFGPFFFLLLFTDSGRN
jgi:hypothetical protein